MRAGTFLQSPISTFCPAVWSRQKASTSTSQELQVDVLHWSNRCVAPSFAFLSYLHTYDVWLIFLCLNASAGSAQSYSCLGCFRNKAKGSNMRVDTTTMSTNAVPNQLSHQFLAFDVDKNRTESIHSTSCIGVPIAKKSVV